MMLSAQDMCEVEHVRNNIIFTHLLSGLTVFWCLCVRFKASSESKKFTFTQRKWFEVEERE